MKPEIQAQDESRTAGGGKPALGFGYIFGNVAIALARARQSACRARPTLCSTEGICRTVNRFSCRNPRPVVEDEERNDK